ncbi:hypothetical protein HDF26_003020 [Pedobacter cryoconitis]|uniref:hypothetical protein n=1 Tax=Pedobacter cryoconitis TaxID=188932 RepID=UPI0016123A7B|nr:hypothetical protein [Pedobacter cryoconitis]MBB6272563.1 hypothetical protein [Pedobacter cryoconitis]
MKRIPYFLILTFLALNVSCKKDKDQPSPVETVESLICNGTWIEDYTVTDYYDITNDESNSIPDSVRRVNAENGLKITFYKDSKVKLIPKGYTNPVESIWGYDRELEILHTNAYLNLGPGFSFPLFPNGVIEIDKNQLIVFQLDFYYVNNVRGTKQRISTKIYFKH